MHNALTCRSTAYQNVIDVSASATSTDKSPHNQDAIRFQVVLYNMELLGTVLIVVFIIILELHRKYHGVLYMRYM